MTILAPSLFLTMLLLLHAFPIALSRAEVSLDEAYRSELGWTKAHEMTYYYNENDDSIVHQLETASEEFLCQQNDYGQIALHLAVREDHRDIVSVYTKRRICLDIGNRDGDTALHYAAAHGRNNAAQMLVAAGASVKRQNKSGKIPLDDAIEYKSHKIASMLRAAASSGENKFGSSDYVWQMSATSLRKGQGPHDVVHDDISTFMENVVFQQDASIMFLDDPSWGIDSKRGWNDNIFHDIFGNVTKAAGLPVYVYSYNNWSPEHAFFTHWWDHHVATLKDFPKFQFTKYRAIILVLKGRSIVKGMVNVVSGEGGGFCIKHVVLDALGMERQVMPDNDARYYDKICVAQALHPSRSKDLFMGGAPCGWHRPNEFPSTCDNHHRLIADEL